MMTFTEANPAEFCPTDHPETADPLKTLSNAISYYAAALNASMLLDPDDLLESGECLRALADATESYARAVKAFRPVHQDANLSRIFEG